MDYINSGKSDGATIHLGGGRVGSEGYFIEHTIFTDTQPSMKIVQEEIFGPVSVVIKFDDEEGAASFDDVTQIWVLMRSYCRRNQASEQYCLRAGFQCIFKEH
jgi:hypothetical protein